MRKKRGDENENVSSLKEKKQPVCDNKTPWKHRKYTGVNSSVLATEKEKHQRRIKS